jgi:hypothetical protein
LHHRQADPLRAHPVFSADNASTSDQKKSFMSIFYVEDSNSDQSNHDSGYGDPEDAPLPGSHGHDETRSSSDPMQSTDAVVEHPIRRQSDSMLSSTTKQSEDFAVKRSHSLTGSDEVKLLSSPKTIDRQEK